MKRLSWYIIMVAACCTLAVLGAENARALPGSSVYHLTPCVDCHGNGSIPLYAEHIVIKVLDDTGKDLYNKATNTVDIPFKRGKKIHLTTVVGSDEQFDKGQHMLVGWFFKLPAGVHTADGNVSYCFQQINYPGGSEFAYKGNQRLTTAESVFYFDKYLEEQESELWLAMGKRTISKKGLGLKTVKIRWLEEF